MKKTILSYLSLMLVITFTWNVFSSCTTSATKGEVEFESHISIIPEPVNLVKGKGFYELRDGMRLRASGDSREVSDIAEYFYNRVKAATGFDMKFTTSEIKNGIEFSLLSNPDEELGDEGYKLTSTSEKVLIEANKPAGLFYGVQTLFQLLPKEIENNEPVQDIKWIVPAVSITDYPRFAWRGIMLDVSRHFFPKEYVLQYIDQLSRYKYNRFHLHLTDDQGWRIEIKSLPKLTEVGAWRVPRVGKWNSFDPPKPGEAATYGGFYTHEDIKEIVAFAKNRFIEVMPEIDVPGHSMAAIAAYPELNVTKDKNIKVNPGSNFATWHGNGKFTMHIDNSLNPTDEKVYDFLDKVFTEVAELFPFEYIHLGGDECYKGFWERDAGVRAFMAKNKIKDSDELQSYFVKRVNDIIRSKGKKAIGWDEILEGGLAEGAAVMSWRGMKGGIEASHHKAPVVMSPHPMAYLDMGQGEPTAEPPIYDYARLKDSYSWDPVPEEADPAFILGGQGNLWTEQIPSKAQVEYMTYPRAFALAEVFWSPKEKKNWPGFVSKVEDHFLRFDEAKINYARSMYDPIIKVKKGQDGNLVLQMETEVEGLDLYYTIDHTIPSHYYNKYNEPFELPSSVDRFKVISYKNGKPAGKLISISIEDLKKRVGR